MWELPLPTTDAQISSWCVCTELEELWREQPTSWGAAQPIRCARGHPGSQCMGPPIPRAPSRSPEARRPPPPDVTSSSQPSGSLPCDPAPPRPLPSSLSCPSDPFSTLLPKRSSRIQVGIPSSPLRIRPDCWGLRGPKRTAFPAPPPPGSEQLGDRQEERGLWSQKQPLYD